MPVGQASFLALRDALAMLFATAALSLIPVCNATADPAARGEPETGAPDRWTVEWNICLPPMHWR
jgi:hypothetical protein